MIIIWSTRYRFAALVAFAAAAPLAFVALPESLQTRFETIINPEVGPKNAQESGEGRLHRTDDRLSPVGSKSAQWRRPWCVATGHRKQD